MRFTILALLSVLMLGCADSSSVSGRPHRESYSCKIVAEPSVQVAENVSTLIDGQYANHILQYKQGAKILRPSGDETRRWTVTGVRTQALGANTYRLELSQAWSAGEREKILAELAQDPDVEFLEPDYPVTAAQAQEPAQEPVQEPDQELDQELDLEKEIENSSFANENWSHKAINTATAWKLNRGSEEIVVAVIDTGIDYSHPDLQENIWKNPKELPNGKDDDGNGLIDDIVGWNFVENNGRPKTSARSNHGTHVAGIIGARPNSRTGTAGVAPHVKMMALRFMGESGSGLTSDAIRAINYAVDHKVFAINNSWGSKSYSLALSRAITRAEQAGILFVVAAGNGDSQGVGFNIEQTPWYPASYKNLNILSVAASDNEDRLTRFSNFSKEKVDVAAPGKLILSTVTGGKYLRLSGTSMAAPFVTGLAVLMKASHPQLTVEEIIHLVRNTSDEVPSLRSQIKSGGRINAYQAVLGAGGCDSGI